MFQSLELLLLLNCLFPAFHFVTGKILPPKNLSLFWESDFKLHFSWEPPRHSMTNCRYEVAIGPIDDPITEELGNDTTSYSITYWIMEGGNLNFSVKTVCPDGESELANFDVSYPELGKNLICFSYPEAQVSCSWSPASDAENLRFFYRLVRETGSDSSTELQECPSYKSPGDGRTYCDLPANTLHAIHIVLNATVNNSFVRNTFKWDAINSVKPSPLKVTVNQTKDGFLISWTPPDLLKLSFWKFEINYTECGKVKRLIYKELTSHQLTRVPHCQYCISVTARRRDKNVISDSTPPSDPKCFDAELDVNPLVFAAVIIPLVFALLAVLTFVCCWKNKDIMFPSVPEPRNLVSDISDNNNKISVHKFYVPSLETEENCKITLIVDTQTSQPDC